jgi:hypothetical protein
MSVVFIKDYVKSRAALPRPAIVPAPAATESKTTAKVVYGEAWYHQAAIAEADKSTPRPH